ncbi:hypothetical protein HDU77_004196 [Chytriomyces hyalinus]|nr:hypothetical protein HDU77_004196 [Chytriomyces hyalinus]
MTQDPPTTETAAASAPMSVKDRLLQVLPSKGLSDPDDKFLDRLATLKLSPETTETYDCMLSYSVDQVGVAIRMHGSLAERGFSVLLDLDKFNGTQVYERIVSRVLKARVTIPLVLRAYEECHKCRHELVFGASLLTPKPVIPVFLDEGPWTWTRPLTETFGHESISINRRHIGDSDAWEDVMDVLASELASVLKKRAESTDDTRMHEVELLEEGVTVEESLESCSIDAEYTDDVDVEDDEDDEENPFGAPPGLSPTVPGMSNLTYINRGNTPPIAPTTSNMNTQPLYPSAPVQAPLARALDEYLNDLEHTLNHDATAYPSQSPSLLFRSSIEYMGDAGSDRTNSALDFLVSPSIPSHSSTTHLLHTGQQIIANEQEVIKERMVEMEFQLQEQNLLRRSIAALEAKTAESDRLKEIVRGLVLEQKRMRDQMAEMERKAAKQSQLMVKIVEFLGLKLTSK